MRRLITRSISTTAASRIPATSSASRASVLSSKVATGSSSSSAGVVAARRLHVSAQQMKPAAQAAEAAPTYDMTHEKLEDVVNTPYFIDNKFVQSTTDKYIDLPDPATNNLVTRVPQMTDEEMKAAVASAEKAFPAWRDTSIMRRQQIMFKFVQLIKDNMDRLAASITIEQGKTFADAKGDVLRGLQVAEACVGAPELLKGELLEVAKDMETRTYREPLGVTAAICPFSKYTNCLAICNLSLLTR